MILWQTFICEIVKISQAKQQRGEKRKKKKSLNTTKWENERKNESCWIKKVI